MYNITVGNGGNHGDTTTDSIATNGKESKFEGIIAHGGGAGSIGNGNSGGSGGGGFSGGSSIQSKDKTNYGFLYNLTDNGQRLNIYGNNGGSISGYNYYPGGGGAGSNGKNIGGDSINLSHIFGNTVGENGYFARGGAARGHRTVDINRGMNGKPNTGNGGGGGIASYLNMLGDKVGGGGRGGSGIVLIKLHSTKLYFNQFTDDKISFDKIDNFPTIK
jgi:hypothetical protein